MKRSWYPLLLAALVLTSSCNQNRSASEAAAADDIRKTIQLADLSGQPVDLTKFEGRLVFLNFWATWCRPCIEEMPSIANAQKQLGDEVVFLFASDEDVERIKSFEKKNSLGIEYVQVANFNELNIQALPTTYIFDANGKIVFSETGYRKWDDPSNLQLLQNLMNRQ
jgi:thiol-disulfide isomerase/thioredoxin